MKRKSLMVGALLAFCAFGAGAAELTLFGLPLSSAHRADIKAAALAAGARLTHAGRDSDKFNAAKLGLPGAQTLEIVYLHDNIVMAQYAMSKEEADDERFRRMLAAKYGNPQPVENPFPTSNTRSFTEQSIPDGKYRWKFDNNTELVFTKEFFGDRFLTYVNKTSHAEMSQKLRESEQNSAAQAAKAKSAVF